MPSLEDSRRPETLPASVGHIVWAPHLCQLPEVEGFAERAVWQCADCTSRWRLGASYRKLDGGPAFLYWRRLDWLDADGHGYSDPGPIETQERG